MNTGNGAADCCLYIKSLKSVEPVKFVVAVGTRVFMVEVGAFYISFTMTSINC